MTLTRDFKETVKARVEQDPAFKAALFVEAIELLLNGDVDTGKAILRDYINATIGFEALAQGVNTPSKSLMRMFSEKGNPGARHIFPVISHLQKQTDISIRIDAAE